MPSRGPFSLIGGVSFIRVITSLGRSAKPRGPSPGDPERRSIESQIPRLHPKAISFEAGRQGIRIGRRSQGRSGAAQVGPDRARPVRIKIGTKLQPAFTLARKGGSVKEGQWPGMGLTR